MSRELSEEEMDWLEEYPVGESHSVEGAENLAACSDCEWVGQAESFDYLMQQVTTHLKESYAPLDEAHMKIRAEAFKDKFEWDPWKEGVIVEGEVETQGYDVLVMEFLDDDGEVAEEWFVKEMGPEDDEGE